MTSYNIDRIGAQLSLKHQILKAKQRRERQEREEKIDRLVNLINDSLIKRKKEADNDGK